MKYDTMHDLFDVMRLKSMSLVWNVVWVCEVVMFKEFQGEVLCGGVLVYVMT